MRKYFAAALILALVFFISGCAYKNNNEYVEKTDFLLDTVVTVRLYDGDDETLEKSIDMIKAYEGYFSSTDPKSDVSLINENVGRSVTVHPETAELISVAKKYGELSSGAFDVTIGEVSSLWDFHSDDPTVPTDSDIASAIKTVDYNNITIDGDYVTLKEGKLDLGGIAKGYITDRLRDYLISEGVTSASISLGGNVYIIGTKPGSDEPFTVGIQKPFSDGTTPAATIQVRDKSVVTSGVYQRYFEKDGVLYHHLLDTKTGWPIENDLYSVTIISDDSTDGDALSTFVFSLGLKKGMDYVESMPDIDGIFITSDNEVLFTSGVEKYNPVIP